MKKYTVFALLTIVMMCLGLMASTTTVQAKRRRCHTPTLKPTYTATFMPTATNQTTSTPTVKPSATRRPTLNPIQIYQTAIAAYRRWCPIGVCSILGTPYPPPTAPTRTSTPIKPTPPAPTRQPTSNPPAYSGS
ncbi:MAG: hypothetical protein P4L50_03205 [Anaerolineaceae bacterium]|nr:hypothetical protein [Anaerolineaceae bacterium]